MEWWVLGAFGSGAILAAARSITTDLLGDDGSDLAFREGDVRRTAPASPLAPGRG